MHRDPGPGSRSMIRIFCVSGGSCIKCAQPVHGQLEKQCTETAWHALLKCNAAAGASNATLCFSRLLPCRASQPLWMVLVLHVSCYRPTHPAALRAQQVLQVIASHQSWVGCRQKPPKDKHMDACKHQLRQQLLERVVAKISSDSAVCGNSQMSVHSLPGSLYSLTAQSAHGVVS